MKRLVFATGNEGKMKEVRMILKDCDYEILSMKEAGVEVDVEENGKTFEENALMKAKAVFEHCNNVDVVLADDSGLEVDYLDKAPGVYSARFMGEDTSYHIKNNAIIEKLEGVKEENRTARFVCVIAGYFADGTTCTTKGTIEGIIGYEEQGENGFGYDPIFYLPERGCTTAQLDDEAKNTISHRGKALREMAKRLR